jgi:hypothetical protein
MGGSPTPCLCPYLLSLFTIDSFIKSCLVGILRTTTFVEVSAESVLFKVFIQFFVSFLAVSLAPLIITA